MKEHLPFVPTLFCKVLSVVMVLVLIGFVVVIKFGELVPRDIIGTLISATIFSYMVHLWLMPEEET